MKDIITFNRQTLESVPCWILKNDWDTPPSLFNYGLPPYVFHLIDKPISNEVTECDVLCDFMSQIQASGRAVNYLEIGVSVGKTFFQICKFMQSHNITQYTLNCLDIEMINPTLHNLLKTRLQYDQCEEENYEGSKGMVSLRKSTTINVKTWKNKDNSISYYESDEFDKNVWKTMKTPYNIIFSDALHEPDALLEEYYNLKNNNLIDYTGFVYCFDDLEHDHNGRMWSAVHTIFEDIRNQHSDVKLQHLHVNGWLGEHEGKHNFGVICIL